METLSLKLYLNHTTDFILSDIDFPKANQVLKIERVLNTHLNDDIPNSKISESLQEEVHIWKVVLPFKEDNIQQNLYSHLSPEEKTRFDKFHFDTDKIRFAFSRIGLKNILSRYLNISANNITLQHSNHGKPYIDGYPLHFNLSHSGDYVLYAISLNSIVGIDVEYCKRDLDFLSIAKEFCSLAEYEKLSKIGSVRTEGSDELRRAFYRCWTRKEAFTKALGLGLYFPLSQIEVSFLSSEAPLLLSIDFANIENIDNVEKSLLDNKGWKIQEINLAPDYMASLVTKTI